MKRVLALLLVFTLLFTACSGTTPAAPETPATPGASGAPEAVATGPKPIKDGIFRNIYNTEYTTLDYNNASTETVSYHANLTVCTLVDYDKYGVIQPNLATDWTVSPDSTVYTFKLRNDVDWHTLNGDVYAKATAHDFVDAAQWMLTAENACIINSNLIMVLKNAKEFNEGTLKDFSQVGIKAIDDYTLEYTLVHPVPYFMSMLTYASFFPCNAKFRAEKGTQYGTSNDAILYSGPYTMTTYEPESRRVYDRNENYWNAASYSLKAIEETYNKEANTIAPELFLRNEVDEASKISTDSLDSLMKDPAKNDILYMEPATKFTYFYAFNFDPRYGEEYGPANWKKAVNNLNFRKSFYHVVDKTALAMTIDPYNPDVRLINTFVLPGFANVKGVDYTQLAPLKEITATKTHNLELAKSFKAKAMEELKGKVEFPVKVVMPYNTGSAAMTNRVQLLEQQMERDLGADYIDVILVPYPSTGYSTATRNAGVFSFFEANWGPDYTDPAAVLDPFNGDIAVGKRYGRVYTAEEGMGADGKPVFQTMLNAASDEVIDIEKRYTMMAEAEKYLIDNAYALPFYRSGFEYYLTRLDPFSGFNTMDGRKPRKYAGKVLLDRPYTKEEFVVAQDKYNAECEAALKAATRPQ